jgi:hypothetical protein
MGRSVINAEESIGWSGKTSSEDIFRLAVSDSSQCAKIAYPNTISPV